MKTTLVALMLLAAGGAFAQQRAPGGMMGQGRMPSLKELPAERQVKAVRYCDRKYFVTTVAGDVLEFREFDLRFKTDAAEQGPRRGTPALLPAGMMGERAFLVFSDPAEISAAIEKKCG
jgi:cytochrome c